MRHSASPVGIIGFGAFGQLVARELNPFLSLVAHDPDPGSAAAAARQGVALRPIEEVARSAVVILATPVASLRAVIETIAPHVEPGALVLDVGSVKTGPAEEMRRGLPAHAAVVATHPLFGPQSARGGVAGLKIAVCPVRGDRHRQVAAFLRRRLGLRVILTTPEDHDREAATVQGLTHLIAKVLVQMGPLPTRMTTLSFDRLTAAVELVRHDAPEVFEAIERANPYAAAVRQRFFALMTALDAGLSGEETRP